MPFGDPRPQKSELLIRIVLQNSLLLIATLAFLVSGVLSAGWPDAAWPLAVVHAIASGALILQWCHHGVRTAQVKAFLLEREGRDPDSWEVWLPAHRPASWLGSRWFISTKGVFLGLQASHLALVWWVTRTFDMAALLLCLAVLAVSTGLLLTNPKE